MGRSSLTDTSGRHPPGIAMFTELAKLRAGESFAAGADDACAARHIGSQ